MVHGAIENGKIFYSNSARLGCFLARQGYDVYVLDMRGRGGSEPRIDGNADYGQTDTIVSDLPAVIDYVANKTQQPMHVIGHSWGGVLLASTLARFPELRQHVLSKVCFGTKRSVSVHNPERWFKVDLCWNRLAPYVVKREGFLDAKKWRIGSDSETQKSLSDSIALVKLRQWKDPIDSFNYGQAAQEFDWPPVWHIPAVKDAVLGHPKDVKRFADESVGLKHSYDYTILGKRHGNKHDYDHIDMLTHPLAEKTISPWLPTG